MSNSVHSREGVDSSKLFAEIMITDSRRQVHVSSLLKSDTKSRHKDKLITR